MRLVIISMALLTASLASAAPQRVAVLPLDNPAGLPGQEVTYLTNLVRKAAMRSLPNAEFTVMTQENMEAMLPPGKTLADCVAEASCEVDLGKAMKAHYVVTGEVVRFGGSLRLAVKVHVTATKGFLEQIDNKAQGVEAFETTLETKAPILFAAIRTHAGGTAPTLGAGAAVSPGGAAPKASEFVVSGAAEAVVRFVSEPTGALVTVGGKALCTTPCSRTLTAGRHRVAMAKLGFIGKEESIAAAGEQTLEWSLTENVGTLTLTSPKRGAPIRITGPDGRVAGSHATPLTIKVRPGRYTVEVGDPKCTTPHSQTLDVRLGESASADFKPAVKMAGLKVSVVDESGNSLVGELSVAGNRIGSTLSAHSLPVCSTDLEVRLEDRPSLAINESLEAGRTTHLELRSVKIREPAFETKRESLFYWSQNVILHISVNLILGYFPGAAGKAYRLKVPGSNDARWYVHYDWAHLRLEIPLVERARLLLQAGGGGGFRGGLGVRMRTGDSQWSARSPVEGWFHFEQPGGASEVDGADPDNPDLDARRAAGYRDRGRQFARFYGGQLLWHLPFTDEQDHCVDRWCSSGGSGSSVAPSLRYNHGVFDEGEQDYGFVGLHYRGVLNVGEKQPNARIKLQAYYEMQAYPALDPASFTIGLRIAGDAILGTLPPWRK